MLDSVLASSKLKAARHFAREVGSFGKAYFKITARNLRGINATFAK